MRVMMMGGSEDAIAGELYGDTLEDYDCMI